MFFLKKSRAITVLLILLCVSCGAPSTLQGKWFTKSQECLLKGKTSRFKDTFSSKHVLHFQENKQVQLLYPEFKTANKETNEDQTCDVVITGEYSGSFFGGSIYFDFKNDETGGFRISKGQNCDLSSDIKLPQKMPEGSPYAKDPKVSLVKVNAEELHLGFTGHTQCEGEKLIFIFTRNKEEDNDRIT